MTHFSQNVLFFGIFASQAWRASKSASSPSVVVGVVGIAHSIEVELLEELDVSHHGLFRNSFAPAVFMHVPVHALDHDGLVVVQQLVPLDLILAEPHLHITCHIRCHAHIECQPEQRLACESQALHRVLPWSVGSFLQLSSVMLTLQCSVYSLSHITCILTKCEQPNITRK